MTTATLAIATDLLDGAILNGGVTIPAPETGYMVGGRVATLTLALEDASAARIAEWVDAVKADDARHIGSWLDSGTLYLDVCDNVLDRGEAIALGEARSELAIWDVQRGEEIATLVMA